MSSATPPSSVPCDKRERRTYSLTSLWRRGMAGWGWGGIGKGISLEEEKTIAQVLPPLSFLSALGKTKPFALHSPPPSSSFLLLLLGFQPLSRAGKSVIMALRNSNDFLLLRTQRIHLLICFDSSKTETEEEEKYLDFLVRNPSSFPSYRESSKKLPKCVLELILPHLPWWPPLRRRPGKNFTKKKKRFGKR